MERDRIREAVILVAIMWIVRAIDFVLPIDMNVYGLIPRTVRGLLGIVTMPFLHAGWWHLIGNTVPLCILLFVLSATRNDRWQIVLSIVLLGGGMLWCFGRSAVHVGASGLVYGLVAFLIAFGLLSRDFVSVLVSLVIGFLYGTTLLSGILPSVGSPVSWDGHLFGAIAGCATAFLRYKFGSKPISTAPELKAIDSEKF